MAQKTCMVGTMGTVVQIQDHGIEEPTVVSVGYSVNGNNYRLTETLKVKDERWRFRHFRAARKKRFVMGRVKVGSKVRVMYSPQHPAKAFLRDNIGVWSV